MTIGAGIAVAAIWGCATASMFAPDASGGGMMLALVVALGATALIALASS